MRPCPGTSRRSLRPARRCRSPARARRSPRRRAARHASGAARARGAAGACSRRGTGAIRSASSPRSPLCSRAVAWRRISSTALRDLMKQIVRAPAGTRSANRSAASLSAEARTPSASSSIGGFHIAIWRSAAGEPSRSISAISLQAGQPLRELQRVGDRRAREQEARLGPIGGRDPPQPPQHVAHVRAEHAAVDVRLVDDDDREVGEEVSPRAVVGQDPDVQHVGVGEHDVGLAADRARAPPAACRRRRSPGARARSRSAPSARAWSCASALVGYRYSARARGSTSSC